MKTQLTTNNSIQTKNWQNYRKPFFCFVCRVTREYLGKDVVDYFQSLNRKWLPESERFHALIFKVDTVKANLMQKFRM